MGQPQAPPPPAVLLRLLLLLLTLLGLFLDPALASADSNGIDSDPRPVDSNTGGGGGSGSTDIIGAQPATVQLGSGFIVGCVIGVILYTVVRLSMRVVRSTLADTRRNGREENNTTGEGVLVEV